MTSEVLNGIANGAIKTVTDAAIVAKTTSPEMALVVLTIVFVGIGISVFVDFMLRKQALVNLTFGSRRIIVSMT